ncbi:MAG: MATE family efflux transporter [Clostridiales bacterium]|nr:MATE family efflux transporter [Clostridiales bacterium]
MASRTKNMTQGNPTRLILLFSLPILAGTIFQQMYNLVDTFVVGRAEGVTALAAVASTGWLDWTLLGIIIGLAQGFAIQIAHCFGAGDPELLRRSAGQSLVLAGLITAALEIIAQVSLRPVLTLMNTPADTYDLTLIYLRIVFGGLPLVMGYNLFSGFLRSVGNSRTPMIAVTCSAGCNIILDILFVARFHWGVVGVAAATVISQAFSCLVCLISVLRLPDFRLSSSDLRLTRKISGRLIGLGLPIAFQNLIISVGGLILQSVVNAQGFLFMAGYNAASRMQGLMEMAGTALRGAVSTFVGQNYGARKMGRVRSGLLSSVKIAVMMAMLIGGAVILWGKPLLRLFLQDDPKIVEQVLVYGYRFLIFMGASLFALYLLFVFRSALQGLGDSFTSMISGILELFMRSGCALVLPLFMGEWGIYTSGIISWFGAAALLAFSCNRRLRHLSAQAEECVVSDSQ